MSARCRYAQWSGEVLNTHFLILSSVDDNNNNNVAQVKSSLSTPAQLVSFLAASSLHSGDWLQAMPISSCGLRLGDEAVRIGIE